MEESYELFSKLNNNQTVPNLGFGTYLLDNVESSIENAVKIGYRLFDTAKYYDNEEQIGQALNKCIKDGLVKREELFISTKLWMDDLDDPEKALNLALKRLNLDYLDVYFIHWPLPHVENEEIKKLIPLSETWRKLELCVEKGLTKSLGLSNFHVQIILDLLSYCKIKPVLLQVELHPLLSQPDLQKFCKKFEIKLMAYNPILRGSPKDKVLDFEKYNILNNEIILDLSKKYSKTPTQIILNWHIYNNVLAIPKSSTYEHQKENYDSQFFKMTDEDYQKVSDLNINKRFHFSKLKPFAADLEVFV